MKLRLPAYMIPRAILSVTAIPKTNNGKVDRAALISDGVKMVARRLLSDITESNVAPRDEMEQKIAAIFSEVLHVDQVGIHDDFFELGGHSLLAAELASKLRPWATAPIPLYMVLASPTVGWCRECFSWTRNRTRYQ